MFPEPFSNDMKASSLYQICIPPFPTLLSTTDVISECKLYQLTTTGVKFVAYRLSLKITDVWSLAR